MTDPNPKMADYLYKIAKSYVPETPVVKDSCGVSFYSVVDAQIFLKTRILFSNSSLECYELFWNYRIFIEDLKKMIKFWIFLEFSLKFRSTHVPTNFLLMMKAIPQECL